MRTADLQDGSVTTAKIADGTVAVADLSTGALNNFLKLASVGDHKVAFGNQSITVSASVTGTTADFAHGLGATPSCVLATATGGGTETKLVATVDHVGSTNIRLTVRYADEVARTATVTVYWLAIA